MKRLCDRIFYIEATASPLSADVGVIFGDRFTYIFDVGSDCRAADEINSLSGDKIVILSHFHRDHIENLPKIVRFGLYQSAFTGKYTAAGTIVGSPVTLNDGIGIEIFPLPSSHAKGCVALISGDYAFLGDGTYGAVTQNGARYNVSLLGEQIRLLGSLPVKYFLLSHNRPFVNDKEQVLDSLHEIYAMRKKGEPYIFTE